MRIDSISKQSSEKPSITPVPMRMESVELVIKASNVLNVDVKQDKKLESTTTLVDALGENIKTPTPND